MRKITVVLVAVLCFGLVAATSLKAAAAKDEAAGSVAASGGKFGYVDLNRALNETNEGKAAKAKLEADGKAKKQKLEIMQGDLKKMKEDLDKQRLILSADAMKAKEQEFQQKFMEMQKTSMDFEKSFGEAEATAIKPISEKLQRVIQSIGQRDGYTLIVPREAALFSLPGSDVTEKVIAEFNKSK